MNTDFIKGVVVPILTPIDKEEFIDEAAFRRQIDYVINGGMHGILVFGSNGEFYQIEEDEMFPGGRKNPRVLWHWRDQHQKVRPPCQNGGCQWRSGSLYPPAHVLKAYAG